MLRRNKHHRIDLEVLLGSVTRTVRDAAALMVTRTVREDRVNGNPNRQGGLFSTRFIAHQQPTITPLLPRLHFELPLRGRWPPQPMVTRTVREVSVTRSVTGAQW